MTAQEKIARRKATVRKYYLAHRDEILAKDRKWQAKNPEKVRAIQRRSDAKRKGTRTEEHKLRWYKNWDRNRAVQRKYYAEHKAEKFAANLARSVRRKHSPISDRPAIKAIYRRARELRQWFDVVVDHIIPISLGGLHISSNLQIISRIENARKWTNGSYQPTIIYR